MNPSLVYSSFIHACVFTRGRPIRNVGRCLGRAEGSRVAAGRRPEVAELHFHDLRGTAITMLAEAGATVPEIAAITGHTYRTIKAILEKYLPRTKHLAEMAIAKLENSGRTDFANRLQNSPSTVGKGDLK